MSSLRSLFETVWAPVDSLLGSLPMGAARLAVVLLLLIPTIVVLRQKRERIYEGAPDQARWRDLRIWAALFVLPYLLIYLLF